MINPNRKTVLFISHDASRTGAPLFLLRFLDWFRGHSETQFKILIGRAGELSDEFKALGSVDYFESDSLAFKILRRLHLHHWFARNHRSNLRQRLQKSKISVIYANSIASAEMVDFLSFLNVPIIWHVHELESVIESLAHRYLEVLKKPGTRYIAVSEVVEKNLTDKHNIPGDNVELVYGFVPVPDNLGLAREQNRELIRRELQISLEAKLVCACGTIEFRKGTDLFLQVARRLKQNDNSSLVHFIWVGDGLEKEKYIQQAASFDLKETVHFVGQKSHVVPYFEASDLFLVTSREEALPLVMLEAAMQQIPIICFDNSGHPPEFVKGNAGVAIPDFNPNKMGEKILELFSSADLCEQMGRAAKQKVLSKYNLDINGPKIARIIEDALLVSN
jgi:glycosyltransferase involved in cell wall biosynthesis